MKIIGVALVLLGAVLFGARWLRPVLQSGSVATESPMATPIATPLADDVVVIDEPLPLASISSPLRVAGKARGTWFFEGSFPVILTDWDGRIIATVPAQAQSEWMTTDWVPFEAILTFEKPSYGARGSLILKKDNPSGLPEHDDAREMTIFFR
ncbi:MAG: Gmad2 immunoglobulin-like domain-containing protein [Candidatus Yanofskybacteria bacterium]|nr:Gmad2 immunoglobulin-like domain-containing protein [Candidatus Yanofskybacteria bacterium]